jgi:hypothetical protein
MNTQIKISIKTNFNEVLSLDDLDLDEEASVEEINKAIIAYTDALWGSDILLQSSKISSKISKLKI